MKVFKYDDCEIEYRFQKGSKSSLYDPGEDDSIEILNIAGPISSVKELELKLKDRLYEGWMNSKIYNHYLNEEYELV